MPEWKPEILRRLTSLNLVPTREAEIADELKVKGTAGRHDASTQSLIEHCKTLM